MTCSRSDSSQEGTAETLLGLLDLDTCVFQIRAQGAVRRRQDRGALTAGKRAELGFKSSAGGENPEPRFPISFSLFGPAPCLRAS